MGEGKVFFDVVFGGEAVVRVKRELVAALAPAELVAEVVHRLVDALSQGHLRQTHIGAQNQTNIPEQLESEQTSQTSKVIDGSR